MESYKRWSSDDSHLERAKEKLIQRLLNNPERRSLNDTGYRVIRIPEERKNTKKHKQEQIDFIITDEEGNHISNHTSDRDSNSISDQNHNISDHYHRSSLQFSEKDDDNFKEDVIHEDALTESKGSSPTCPYMSVEVLKQLARDEIKRKLDAITDSDIQEHHVKTWCNEISHNIRGKLIELTNNEEKIVVTTYMVPRVCKNAVSVHVQCRKCPQDDNFMVVVVESELMFVWVNMFLSPYS